MMTPSHDKQATDPTTTPATTRDPVRRAKIARLRREIAAGTYVADADATAAALLKSGALTAE